MSEQFTKGPWFVYEGKQFLIIKGKVCSSGDDGEPIVVADTNHYFSESKANAALIACAPEMYEMLKWLSVAVLKDGSIAHKNAVELIAKARGEL